MESGRNSNSLKWPREKEEGNIEIAKREDECLEEWTGGGEGTAKKNTRAC